MGRWNVAQTSAYHIQSAQASIETTLKDAANHYGDSNYLTASWERIKEQLGFIAETAGMPEEARKQLYDQHWTQLQSGRFQAWAEDDPASALARFKMEAADIDPDTRRKLNGYLWSRAKPLLVLQVSRAYGKSMLEKPDFVSSMMKRKTGIATVDSLSQAQKMELWSAAYSRAASDRNVRRDALRKDIANERASIEAGIEPARPVTRDRFIDLMGEEDGSAAWEEHWAGIDATRFLRDMSGLTNEEILDELDHLATVEADDPDFAVKKKRVDALNQAVDRFLTLRQADPMAAAAAAGRVSAIDFNGDIPAQLRDRELAAAGICDEYDAPGQLLSRAEMAVLQRWLGGINSLDPEKAAAAMQQLLAAPGSERGLSRQGLAMLAAQMGDDNLQAILISQSDNIRSGGRSVTEKVKIGQGYISGKLVAVDKAVGDGWRAALTDAIGGDGSALPVFTDPNAIRDYEKIWDGLVAYHMINGATGSGQEAVRLATQDLFGRMGVTRGRKVILPDHGNFDDKVNEWVKANIRDDDCFFIRGRLGRVMGSDLKAGIAANDGRIVEFVTQSRLPGGGVSYRIRWGGDDLYRQATDRALPLLMELGGAPEPSFVSKVIDKAVKSLEKPKHEIRLRHGTRPGLRKRKIGSGGSKSRKLEVEPISVTAGSEEGDW